MYLIQRTLCDAHVTHKKFVLAIFTISMMNLRYTSFGSEWCLYRKRMKTEGCDDKKAEQSDKVEEKLEFDVLNMLNYCLYLPTCYSGPVFNYDQFYTQVCFYCYLFTFQMTKFRLIGTLRILIFMSFSYL